MIINRISFSHLSNWQIPFGQEAVVWYFWNSCVALIKTNDSLCCILESGVSFSTVSAITSLNFELTVICRIFRLWLTVLSIFSPLSVPHMDGGAHHTSSRVTSEGIMTFPVCGDTAENTCASPAGPPPSGRGCVYVSLNLTPEAKSHLNCNKNITPSCRIHHLELAAFRQQVF